MTRIWIYAEKLELKDGLKLQEGNIYINPIYFDEDGDYFRGGIKLASAERRNEEERGYFFEIEAEALNVTGAGWHGFFVTQFKVLNINSPTKNKEDEK